MTSLAVFSIFTEDQQLFLGTAFLISSNQALTAFHCVGDRFQDITNFSRVCLRNRTGTQAIRAKLIWHDAPLDAALLQLEEPFVSDKPFAVVNTVKANSAYIAHGFPAQLSRNTMHTISGHINNPQGHFNGTIPAIHLFCHEAGVNQGLSLHGISGGPVIVDGAVAGFIRNNPPGSQNPMLATGGIVYATPIQAILDCCPYLDKAILTNDITLHNLQNPSLKLEIPISRRNSGRFNYRSNTIAFVGRENELAKLHDTTQDEPGDQLIVWLMTGPGGQGKSRLARHFAEQMAKEKWVTGFYNRNIQKEDLPIDWQPVAPTLIVMDYVSQISNLARAYPINFCVKI